MMQITDTAKERIQEILGNNSGKYLRLFIQGMGWGGPTMGMALDEPKDNEQPVNVNGIDILVEDFARPIVDGTKIDYIENPDGKGFVVTRDGEDC